MKNKKVLVRTENAGVFYGAIESRNGSEVVMRNTRRIWYWEGAFTLSEMSIFGVSKPNKCKFSAYVDEITIIGVIEIIPCTEQAIINIESVTPWQI